MFEDDDNYERFELTLLPGDQGPEMPYPYHEYEYDDDPAWDGIPPARDRDLPGEPMEPMDGELKTYLIYGGV